MVVQFAAVELDHISTSLVKKVGEQQREIVLELSKELGNYLKATSQQILYEQLKSVNNIQKKCGSISKEHLLIVLVYKTYLHPVMFMIFH